MASTKLLPTRPVRQTQWLDFLANYGILIVLVLLVIVLSILSPIIRDGQQLFLTPRNLIQIALQASINAIIAVGMTFVITAGGIDLSVGSVVALCGVLAAMVMRDVPAVGPLGGFIVAVIVGALCGALNGLLITRANLPPFVATLGTMGIVRGLALIVSDGRSIYGFDRSFNEVFGARIPLFSDIELPVAVIIAAIVAVLGWLVLNRLKLGKYTIAIGGNEDVTRLAGIPVNRYKMTIYMLCGLLTGVGGALLLARLNSGDPTFGSLFELNAIAATVIGGTSLSGGTGSIGGTIVGALIISLVQNAMNIFNVPSYYQQLVIGGVIVLAVMLDQWRKKQRQP